MPRPGEGAIPDRPSSEHLVQLFDEPDSLVTSVAEFLFDGWERGDHLLVVARAANWALTAAELQARGCPVAEATASGRLVVLDAATTLATFMVNGDPDPEKFNASVGELVSRLCGGATAMSIYGEMVDILVGQGNYVGAEQLEARWNGLGERCCFRLLCGYSSAHFGDDRTARHFNAICTAHHDASARATDLLASWLLANRHSKHHH